MMVGFVIYALLSGSPSPLTHKEEFKDAGNGLVSQSLIDLKSYQDKIFPDRHTTLRVKDLRTGSGSPAVCGQNVTIAYEAFLPDGAKISDSAGSDKPLSFRIGENKVLPAFEQGVIGMQKGGKRSLVAPPNMSYGIKEFARADVPEKSNVRLDVELLEASPALPSLDDVPYRIANISQGSGHMLLCGDSAKLAMTIWSAEGKKLFSNTGQGEAPLSITLGKSELFMGLEQGVIGMNVGGQRLLVVPPAFQRTMHGNAPALDILPKNSQTVLVEVEALP